MLIYTILARNFGSWNYTLCMDTVVINKCKLRLEYYFKIYLVSPMPPVSHVEKVAHGTGEAT